jgi:hypothetical protein
MTTELDVRYLWVPHALGGHRIAPYEGMRVSIRWQRYIEASLEGLRDVGSRASRTTLRRIRAPRRFA